jgi:ubiquinone/menaquinone biosynthesis C-methylase UbiE
MFNKSAQFYDAIYSQVGKDYAGEAARIHALIQEYGRSAGDTLLDVACGTGEHLAHLRTYYKVEGLDLDPNILEVARRRHPDVPFHLGDMADFDLGRQFDAITCLFSSIGYVKTVPRLNQAVANMLRHVKPGGVLLVEPWFAPAVFKPAGVYATFVDQPALKIARMNVTRVEDGISVLDFHYLVATPAGVEHFTERHELALFTNEEYEGAFRAAGVDAAYDAQGLTGRGLYMGRKRS